MCIKCKEELSNSLINVRGKLVNGLQPSGVGSYTIINTGKLM